VLDGHSGEIRCLSPEELTPPGPYDTPLVEPADAGDAGIDAGASSDAGANGPSRRDGAADASSAIPLRPISVSLEGLAFENGEVPRAPAALERFKKDFVRCGSAAASNDPGSLRSDAVVEVRFIVRAPGRAEGVDVVQSRGVSADIVRCVTTAVANRPIGAPSSDPVGVQVSIRFRKD
jgi:hypothetical protein